MKTTYTYIQALFVVALAMMLTGCFGTTKVITKVVTRYQEVPAELTTLVKPTPPVDRVVYLAMPVTDRELYLTSYTVDLLKGIHMCNVQLNAVSSLSTKWKALGHENKP